MDKKNSTDGDDLHMGLVIRLIKLDQKISGLGRGSIEQVFLKNLNLAPFDFRITATQLGRLLCSGIPTQPQAIRLKDALELVLGKFGIIPVFTNAPRGSSIEILPEAIDKALSIVEQSKRIRSLSRASTSPSLSDIEEEADNVPGF